MDNGFGLGSNLGIDTLHFGKDKFCLIKFLTATSSIVLETYRGEDIEKPQLGLDIFKKGKDVKNRCNLHIYYLGRIRLYRSEFASRYR